MSKSKNYEGFGERLADELSYQGYSHKAFAEKIGISINTLNIYLHRNSMPAADIAVRMADALNTTVEYLVKGKPLANNRARQKTELSNIASSLNQNQLLGLVKIARAYKESVQSEE